MRLSFILKLVTSAFADQSEWWLSFPSGRHMWLIGTCDKSRQLYVQRGGSKTVTIGTQSTDIWCHLKADKQYLVSLRNIPSLIFCHRDILNYLDINWVSTRSPLVSLCGTSALEVRSPCDKGAITIQTPYGHYANNDVNRKHGTIDNGFKNRKVYISPKEVLWLKQPW